MDRAPDPALIDAARARVQAVTNDLRQISDGDRAVPGLDWSVTDLGQHVACLPSFWSGLDAAGSNFDRPDDFAAYSQAARAHIEETEPNDLADRIDAEFEAFITDLSADRSRWLYGIPTTATNMLGLTLNECVLHGRDLAAVTGTKPPTFEPAEANAAVAAIMVTTPVFVDAERAEAQPDGVYHLHFRGGRDYTWTKRGAELIVTDGRPARADARLNADPAAFLMASLGRIGNARVAATGAMIAYGRRPWRFLALPKLTVDGV